MHAKPRVLIVGDRRKAGVSEGVAHHEPMLRERLDVVAVDLDGSVDLAAAEADLVLVFGGDGSILHVARRLGDNPLPVLGVNYGHFGFLADLEPDDLEAGIARWTEGRSIVTARRRLDVVFRRGATVARTTRAFNDVVVGRSRVGGMVDVVVEIDGRSAVTYSGDGLIVATASGSTAHALAAGGPLVEPSVEAVLLVPIAPHALSARPLVVPARHRIELSTRDRRGAADVTVDGTDPVRLVPGDVVEVTVSDTPFRLVQSGGHSFYDALRRKLGWRGRPTAARDEADDERAAGGA